VVREGGQYQSSVVVNTSTTTPLGAYTFAIVGTDGAVTASATQVLNLGDYSAGIFPTTVTALPNTTANYTLNVSTVDNYTKYLLTTCSGIPAPATCNVGIVGAPSAAPFSIATNTLAGGNYNFTVSVTNGFTTRTASAQLSLKDFSATFPSTTETIPVGQSGQMAFYVVGINGFTDPVALACGGVPAGVTCSITPSTVTPSSSGTPATMAIAIGSRPNAIGSPQHSGPSKSRLSKNAGISGISFVAILAATLASRRKRALGPLALVMLASLLSCGGGSSIGSAGGGGGGGGGATSVTFSVTVEGSADNVIHNLGTVQVTVP
jgi:hypothetical protein